MLTVFTGFTYSHAQGDSHGDGRVSDPDGAFGPVGGVYELNVKVSEYEAYAGRAGVKLTLPRTLLNFIHAPQFIKPYFSASAGGKYIKGSHADFTAGNFLNQNVNLYEHSFVFTGEANLGYEFELSRQFSVVLESGYGYDTKPDRGDERLGSFSGLNGGGDRLYSTVSLGGKVKF